MSDWCQMKQIHASCIAIGENGVILRGPSASGKSDLALRLIEEGAELVADDRVDLVTKDNKLFASPPSGLKGLLEVRGVGIISLNHLNFVRVNIVIDLVAKNQLPRMPKFSKINLGGIMVPRVLIFPFEISACIKVSIALSEFSKNNCAT